MKTYYRVLFPGATIYFSAFFFSLIPQVWCLLKKLFTVWKCFRILVFHALVSEFQFVYISSGNSFAPRPEILNKKLHFIYISIYIILKN
jgi:hypothetical protein